MFTFLRNRNAMNARCANQTKSCPDKFRPWLGKVCLCSYLFWGVHVVIKRNICAVTCILKNASLGQFLASVLTRSTFWWRNMFICGCQVLHRVVVHVISRYICSNHCSVQCTDTVHSVIAQFLVIPCQFWRTTLRVRLVSGVALWYQFISHTDALHEDCVCWRSKADPNGWVQVGWIVNCLWKLVCFCCQVLFDFLVYSRLWSWGKYSIDKVFR